MGQFARRLRPHLPLLCEAVRYLGSAVAGLGVDWSVWTVLAYGAGMDATLAQAISRSAGGVVSFAAFRRFVFTHPGAARGGLASRYWVAFAATWCLSVLLVSQLSDWLPRPLAKICTDGTTFVVNYAVMKLWVFGRTPPPGTAVS